jgi:hypothetical protein
VDVLDPNTQKFDLELFISGILLAQMPAIKCTVALKHLINQNHQAAADAAAPLSDQELSGFSLQTCMNELVVR